MEEGGRFKERKTDDCCKATCLRGKYSGIGATILESTNLFIRGDLSEYMGSVLCLWTVYALIKLLDIFDEAESWAMNEYQIALGKGDRLTKQERQKVIEQIARYTGLSPVFIDNNDLRVDLGLASKR